MTINWFKWMSVEASLKYLYSTIKVDWKCREHFTTFLWYYDNRETMTDPSSKSSKSFPSFQNDTPQCQHLIVIPDWDESDVHLLQVFFWFCFSESPPSWLQASRVLCYFHNLLFFLWIRLNLEDVAAVTVIDNILIILSPKTFIE